MNAKAKTTNHHHEISLQNVSGKKAITWVIETLQFVVFGTWIIAWGVGVLWYFEPLPIHYIEREIVTPRVAPGHELVIRVTAMNSDTGCKTMVDRYIFDAIGKEHKFATEQRLLRQGYEVRLIIPPGAAIGPAKYVAEITWMCNPVQTILPRRVTQEAIGFQIVSPTSSDRLQLERKFGLSALTREGL